MRPLFGFLLGLRFYSASIANLEYVQKGVTLGKGTKQIGEAS
jgi:hypothetical protein